MSADALRRKVSEALDGAGGLDAPEHATLRAELAADEDSAEWARDAAKLDALLRGWPTPERGEDFFAALAARIDERVAADKGAAGPDLTSPPFFDDADVRAARLATQAGKGVEGLRALDAKRAAFSLDQLSELGGAAPPAAPAKGTSAVAPKGVAKTETPVAPAAPVVSSRRADESVSMDSGPIAQVSKSETMRAAAATSSVSASEETEEDVPVDVDTVAAVPALASSAEPAHPNTTRQAAEAPAITPAAPRAVVAPTPIRIDPRPPAPLRDDRVSLPSFRPPIAPLRPLEQEAPPASSRRGWVVGAVAVLAAALVGVAVFVSGGSEQDAPASATAVATTAPAPAVAAASPSEVAAPPSQVAPPPAATPVAAAPEAASAGGSGAALAATSGGAASEARPGRARGGARRVRGDADDLGDPPAGGGGAPSRPASPTAASAPAPRAAPAADPEADEPLPETPDRADVLSAMGSVRGAVAACAAGRGGVVTVRVTFAGSSGRVTTAVIEGAFAGTAEGSCMARAIRAARVPRFAQPTASVSFPFQI